jgi:tetratricopeptide (TPR) repeat protein
VAESHADPSVIVGAASAEVNAGAPDQAAAIVDAGLKAAPHDYQLLGLRAQIDAKAGHLDEALAGADEAIRQRPESHDALLVRAQVLAQMKRYDEALSDLDEAWRMIPLDGRGIAAKADVLEKLGRAPEAMSLYDALVAIDPSAPALNGRCWARALANTELTKAESDCAAAVKLAPNDAGIWDSYALVAFRAGKFADALARYDHALTLDPKLAPSLYGRGVTKLRQGDAAGGAIDIAAARAINEEAGRELNGAGIAP